jgi:hypothetical protein
MRQGLAVLGFAAIVGSMVGAVVAQTPPAGKAAPAKQAPAPPAPATCGPNPSPSPEMKNVAKDSRCFEMRTYVFNPAGGQGSPDLTHARFRQYTIRLFKKHGMTPIGFWQPVTKPDTLVYLMAYKDAATRDAEWAAFQADPEWIKARAEMNVSLTVTNEFMVATDYSMIK